MLLQILTLENLELAATEIEEYLNETCSEDINECIKRGTSLQVYYARSGKMLADAKYWQDEATSKSILKQLGEQFDMPASTLNNLVKASCKRENYLVNWIDRINAACNHQIDWLRTVISKEKAELYAQKPLEVKEKNGR